MSTRRKKSGKVLKEETVEYEDPKCPFCGKGDCLDIVALGEPPGILVYQIRTGCGFFSRPMKSKGACRLLWGTRGGRKPSKLLRELATLARLEVRENPVGEVGGRVIGGSDSARRRKEELEAAAAAQSGPGQEALEEAAGVNKTGSRLNRPIAPF